MLLRAIPILSALALLLSSTHQASAALVSAAPASLPPATSENACTAFLNDASESRIGLLCHNDPINKSDPMGLYVTYSDGWSAADAEKFKKAFDQQWSTKEGRTTWESRYNSKNEFKVSPDRSTGSAEKGASNFNIRESGSRTFLQSIGEALRRDANALMGAAQGSGNFEKGRQGDNTAANQTAKSVADEAGLSPGQREMFHREISKQGYDRGQLLEEARRIQSTYPNK